jgi:phosphatidylglycerol:prolipoprotein diacylglycerol transferase
MQIHWYGLTYLVAFGLFLWLARRRVRQPHWPCRLDAQATSRTCCSTACSASSSAGAWAMRCSTSRLDYLAHPLEVLMVWKGGMSFHGGLLGVLVAMAWLARARRPFWR